MFDTLMESRRRRERRIAGTVASVAVHTGIVLLAIAATLDAHDAPRAAPPVIERPIWTEPMDRPTGDAAPRERRADDAATDGPRMPDFPTDPVPIDPSIPPATIAEPIDLDALLAGERGAGGDRPFTAGADAGAPPPGGIFRRDAVERIAALRPGSPTPRYPEMLRAAGVEGRVRVRFVVDTLGRIEPGSETVLDASDPRFVAAVLGVLPRLRFAPAISDGRAVRMWVEMPFEFRIEGR